MPKYIKYLFNPCTHKTLLSRSSSIYNTSWNGREMTGNSNIRAISFGSLSTRLFFQIEEPTIVRADMNDNSRHSPKQHRHQCEILTVANKTQQLRKSSPELSAFVSTRNLPAGVKLSMGKTVLFKMVPLQFSNTFFDSLTFTQFMRRQVWENWSINYGTPSRARQKQLDHKSHQDLKESAICQKNPFYIEGSFDD